MNDLSNEAQLVLQSLREKPNLNTPTLIAGGPIAGEIDQDAIESSLDELIEAGLVKHRPTGWRAIS